jgi:DNA processing protein
MSNEYYIWLHEKRELPNRRKRELLELHRSPIAVFELLDGTREELEGARRLGSLHEKLGIKLLRMDEPRFIPPAKRNNNTPILLYYKGVIEAHQKGSVAIVGSRKATLYGMTVAQLSCNEYATNGYRILSSLAKGIDAVVHRTALDAGAVTYGFLANGLNACYPKENSELMAEIIETGAVLSAFPADTPPIRQNFYSRNEIMVTWADDVIIAEAGTKSGALLTGELALKNNRKLFTVPNSIFVPGSAGSNRLLQSGALPYLGTLENPRSRRDNKVNSKPHTEMIELLDITPLPTEELSRRLQRSPELILNDLLSLELEDMVRFHPDGKGHSNGH